MAADDFEIQDENLDGVHLIQVHGEADLSTAPELRRRLEEAFGDETKALLVDLSDATFIDSQIVSALFWAGTQSRRLEVDMAVACPADGGPRRVLHVSGLDGTFSVYESRREAALALRGYESS